VWIVGKGAFSASHLCTNTCNKTVNSFGVITSFPCAQIRALGIARNPPSTADPHLNSMDPAL